jgi:hypothetical protein
MEESFETEVDMALAMFVFGIALLVAVLLSEASQRNVLWSAVIFFLFAGFLFCGAIVMNVTCRPALNSRQF